MQYDSINKFIQEDAQPAAAMPIWKQYAELSNSKVANLPLGALHTYSWIFKHIAYSVPTDAALQAIKNFSAGKVIEIGAGSGFWAHCLEQIGVDVFACDKLKFGKKNVNAIEDVNESSNAFWTDVIEGDQAEISNHPEHTLFLCWPEPNISLASDCLKLYEGEYLIFVGIHPSTSVPGYFRTGDKLFFEMLECEWQLVEQISLPTRTAMTDGLYVYKRKGKFNK